MKLGQITEQQFKKTLLDYKYLGAEEVGQAEKTSKERNIDFTDTLLYEGLMTKQLIGQAIAEFYQVPPCDPEVARAFSKEILFPESFASKYRAAILKITESQVFIITDNPGQPDLVKNIEKILFEMRIRLQQEETVLRVAKEEKPALPADPEIIIQYSLPEVIDDILTSYRKPLEMSFVKIIQKEKRVAPEIIDNIVEDALRARASDIHFEPLKDIFIIRFRINGRLQKAGQLSRDYYDPILNSIKLEANLRIDKHNTIQDGAIRWEKEGNIADIRVSIVPTVHGEAVVMRLLARYVSGLTLEQLGLSLNDRLMVEDEIRKPFGMILAAGPTGSGKTTTMYSALQTLNTVDNKIITIEDPVEYKIDHINQIQVNPQANITFAGSLRSVVRQDPDIILVGEIRDEETANLSINASLTGHLLFSTFHSNDAPSAITRLLEMGVAPFMLASTLNVIIAQRLVRKICPSCRKSITLTAADLNKIVPNIAPTILGKSGKLAAFQGEGCLACNNTGFRERTAIFEVIRATPKLKELILQNPSVMEVWRLAKSEGSRSLFDDGMEKVKKGITTISELLRVARPPAE